MSDSKPVKRTRLRRVRRVLFRLAAALVVLVVVLFVTGALMIWRSWPQVSGTIAAQQLKGVHKPWLPQALAGLEQPAARRVDARPLPAGEHVRNHL